MDAKNRLHLTADLVWWQEIDVLLWAHVVKFTIACAIVLPFIWANPIKSTEGLKREELEKQLDMDWLHVCESERVYKLCAQSNGFDSDKNAIFNGFPRSCIREET